MTNALTLDVFVVCQQELYSDGIFDRQWNAYPVIELTDLEPDSPAFVGFIARISTWAKRRPAPIG